MTDDFVDELEGKGGNRHVEGKTKGYSGIYGKSSDWGKVRAREKGEGKGETRAAVIRRQLGFYLAICSKINRDALTRGAISSRLRS
jgi:hypothetical protein